MGFLRKKVGKQATWPKTLSLFFAPIFIVVLFRWALFEPFVIPSESMLPNLFIHDHVIVNKFKYGLKTPLKDGWIFFRESELKRGQVVVFRFPENRDVFYIKRLIGLPGDRIRTEGTSLYINDELVPLESDPAADDQFVESLFDVQHKIKVTSQSSYETQHEQEFVVPEKSFFVMGDNRMNSYDSRFWGFVPRDLMVGPAVRIWLSCEKKLESLPFLCDPMTIRWSRFFKVVE